MQLKYCEKANFPGQFLAKIVINGFWSAKYTKTRKKIGDTFVRVFHCWREAKTIGIVSNMMIKRDCNILQIPLHYKSEKDLKEVQKGASTSVFKFGDESPVSSTEKVTFPCYILGKRTTLSADVVNRNIPLLISKGEMKKRKNSSWTLTKIH